MRIQKIRDPDSTNRSFWFKKRFSILEPALQGLGAPPGVSLKERHDPPPLLNMGGKSSGIPKTFPNHSDTILEKSKFSHPVKKIGTWDPYFALL